MKTVILCGGRGTRLNDMGAAVPKALVTIGGKPVIWHLLKLFASQGLCDFLFCLGFLGGQITEYFAEAADGPSDLVNGGLNIRSDGLVCRVELLDTGLDTNTGGRLKAIENSLAGEQTFLVTYGDGVADVDLRALRNFHRDHGKIATLTAVHPISNFGLLDISSSGNVLEFKEKPKMDEWINGGFFVFDRRIFDYLQPDSILERGPLETLAQEGELMAYRHTGFWKCMDTYKDNIELNELWANSAPWKIW